MIALKKKPKATKCSDHGTIRLISHTTKVVPMIPRRSIEREVENIHGGDEFGVRRGRGYMDAIGMLRMVPDRASDIEEVLYACFIDRQKAFDRVN
jgi:hypothetical protein